MDKSNIVIDTTKMYECGKEIANLSMQLNEELIGLFSRIESINTVTNEWVGLSSEKFVELTRADKIQYFDLKDTIGKYGEYLMESANAYEKSIKGIVREIE